MLATHRGRGQPSSDAASVAALFCLQQAPGGAGDGKVVAIVEGDGRSTCARTLR
jgi:hypothetical protein